MLITKLLLATTTVGAAAIALLTTTGDAQQPPPPPVVHHFSRVVTDGGFLDAPPRRRQSPGDALVESSALSDAAGTIVGRAIDHCVLVDHRDTLNCTGVVLLRRGGTLTFAGRTGMSGRPSAFAVTGGTGPYAGARGWIDDVPKADDRADSTLTLLPPEGSTPRG